MNYEIKAVGWGALSVSSLTDCVSEDPDFQFILVQVESARIREHAFKPWLCFSSELCLWAEKIKVLVL